MKVSNRVEIQKIYQEQLKKVQSEGSGEAFKKVLQGATQNPEGPQKTVFHPPSGVNPMNPVFSGKPIKEADPVQTLKFAAEVVASQPEVRQEKLEKIKSLIAAGQYNIPAEQVAEKLYSSGIVTRSWEV
ncbi:MAG: flagellar biosynthesis anti-sigma factor FlgM [Candidatus Riflebacteria bacterium]|nr:flagellar biosynthesis anti-sigma factor FlgM [Candidatus Riflebacteria bacterium]